MDQRDQHFGCISAPWRRKRPQTCQKRQNRPRWGGGVSDRGRVSGGPGRLQGGADDTIRQPKSPTTASSTSVTLTNQRHGLDRPLSRCSPLFPPGGNRERGVGVCEHVVIMGVSPIYILGCSPCSPCSPQKQVIHYARHSFFSAGQNKNDRPIKERPVFVWGGTGGTNAEKPQTRRVILFPPQGGTGGNMGGTRLRGHFPPVA